MTPQQLMRRSTRHRSQIPTNSHRWAALPKSPQATVTEFEIWSYQLLNEWHKQLLDAVIAAAQQDGYRTDAIWGQIKTALAQFAIRVQQIFSPSRLSARFQQFAGQVVKQNLRTPMVTDPTFGSPRMLVPTDIFIQNNVRLIKSIPEQDLASVEEVFRTPGLTIQDIIEQLEHRFSVSRSRAKRIARDQTLKLNAAITRERQRQAGIQRYIWTTSQDELVRGNPMGKWPLPRSGFGGDHYRLDGTIQSWNAPPIVNTATLRRAHPGEDHECRCGAFPILEGAEDV